ncbi:MAG: hypothetical protein J5979_03030 [Lachnospiraceae bacterium]|nr:hypothetical protein [Lachnospiraceae bacterium]
MSLVANVTDGKVQISESSQDTERKTGSSLDKEDFLMLLVTQMKYQDPLDPADNTEYVAQLAQFSELEQMQNLNQTTTNTSAYTLVGKEVYIETKSTTGETTTVQGTVEYVTVQNGKAQVSVNGELYDYDDIVQVIDEAYLISTYQPSVKNQVHTFLHHDPQSIEISGISLGSNGYQATGMAVILIGQDGKKWQIPADKLSYKDGTLTISKDALTGIEAGEYAVTFIFDDPNTTIDYDSVTLKIQGNPTTAAPDTPDTGSGEENEGDEGNDSTN